MQNTSNTNPNKFRTCKTMQNNSEHCRIHQKFIQMQANRNKCRTPEETSRTIQNKCRTHTQQYRNNQNKCRQFRKIRTTAEHLRKYTFWQLQKNQDTCRTNSDKNKNRRRTNAEQFRKCRTNAETNADTMQKHRRNNGRPSGARGPP